MQLVAAPFAESTALRVAHAYEQATTWHTLRPPLAV
jgi:Asp-tRNA(Asn)/Glu-tRNA(Gln) amidotransferase A subunit family amidase